MFDGLISHEERVIGALISAADARETSLLRRGMGELEPRDFETMGPIFTTMRQIAQDGSVPDSVAIGERLKGGAHWRLFLEALQVTSALVNTAGLVDWCKTQRKHARQRALNREMQRALDSGREEDIDRVVKAVSRAKESSIGDFVTAGEVAKALLKTLEEKAKGGYKYPQTGLDGVDEKLGGFRPGGLSILAARPGVGKTALALNIARNASKEFPVCFVSCEMPPDELGGRMAADLASISFSRIRDGKLRDEQWGQLGKALKALHEMPLTLLDKPGATLADIEIGLDNSPDCKLLIVDYLQLCKPLYKHERHDLGIEEITQGLKNLARERKIHVIALSQLNRAGDSDAPRLSNLRGSGSIEQDADCVMMLYRPKEGEDRLVTLEIAKNRHGRVGSTDLRWEGKYMRFSEIKDQPWL